MQFVSEELFSYAVKHYRHIHMYPEVGFDLPLTADYVAKQLTDLGIEPQHSFGQCAVVGQIGSDPNRPTIGFRADMDALPVTEKTDLPFASTIPGAMHACGHDSHTAIVLAAAKYLKEHEEDLACNVRLMFQPSEEGAISGAKMMVDHGVMDGVECVVATHCEPFIPAGEVGMAVGDYMAACIPMEIRFHGRTAHATLPETGIDALAMAVEAYNALKVMVKEEAGNRKYIWSVGHLAAGDVHNVIPDLATMRISFRFYDIPFSLRVMDRVVEICNGIAANYGGTVEYDWRMSTGPVHNDASVAEKVRTAMGGLTVHPLESKMSSEDFAWYLSKAPGVLFRYGSGNEAKGCNGRAHNNDFKIDEDGMKTAIRTFIRYALAYNK